MKRFVIRQNIEHYRALLTSPPILRSDAQLSSCFAKKKPSSKNTTRIARGRRPAPARRLNRALVSPGSLAKFAAIRFA